MRSKFFQTAERSAVAGTQPAGCGGEGSEFEIISQYDKEYALILLNPVFNVQENTLNVGQLALLLSVNVSADYSTLKIRNQKAKKNILK